MIRYSQVQTHICIWSDTVTYRHNLYMIRYSQVQTHICIWSDTVTYRHTSVNDQIQSGTDTHLYMIRYSQVQTHICIWSDTVTYRHTSVYDQIQSHTDTHLYMIRYSHVQTHMIRYIHVQITFSLSTCITTSVAPFRVTARTVALDAIRIFHQTMSTCFSSIRCS